MEAFIRYVYGKHRFTSLSYYIDRVSVVHRKVTFEK